MISVSIRILFNIHEFGMIKTAINKQLGSNWAGIEDDPSKEEVVKNHEVWG